MLFNAEYNQATNAEKARRKVEAKFATLKGPGPWWTRDLQAMGFSQRNLGTFVKHGLLKKVYQGLYARA